jgi:molybdate/tungstate transport system substrate-binding protein
MARLISEKGERADIMASADFAVIDKNLIPDYADWNIRFATNQLVLCYTDKSKYSNIINSDNWYSILAKKGVMWGHSDPNLDPCGYRSLMVLQLAEKFYAKPGLYNKIMINRPRKNVFEKASHMVSVLKEKGLDYAWEYLSVAVQNDLKYVKMPEHINLGNYKYDKFYQQAHVQVTGKKSGTWMVRRGKSCTYGITLIKQTRNRTAALAFLEYLLDPKQGLEILREKGQPPFIPCRVPTSEMSSLLPESLQRLVKVKK